MEHVHGKTTLVANRITGRSAVSCWVCLIRQFLNIIQRGGGGGRGGVKFMLNNFLPWCFGYRVGGLMGHLMIHVTYVIVDYRFYIGSCLPVWPNFFSFTCCFTFHPRHFRHPPQNQESIGEPFYNNKFLFQIISIFLHLYNYAWQGKSFVNLFNWSAIELLAYNSPE